MPTQYVTLFKLMFTLVFLMPMASIANSLPNNSLPTCTLIFKTASVNITLKNIPVARTEAEMNKGLSRRKQVLHGMLFSWPTAEPRVFWMQDTWVDLSVGFFDANGILFDIQAMQANSAQYHYSVQKTKTALELTQGQFQKIGLVIGSHLVTQDCR